VIKFHFRIYLQGIKIINKKMANEKITVKKETGSGVTPFIIIGLIFLATIVGIWWISQSGEKETAQNNTAASNNGQPQDTKLPNYDKAPQGATPAHFKGAANSPVLVEEFADFQCPTCASMHPKMNEISAKYGNRVKFVFRNYPLITVHKNAYAAAVAAEAAGLQGKFWQMQDLLFRNQTQWSNLENPREQFSDYAKRIGLDVEKFNNDILGVQAKQRVDFDIERGSSLNIRSTPTILINGRPIPSEQREVSEMEQLIDAELAKFGQQDQPTQPASESKASDNNNTSSEEGKKEDAKPDESKK
jgi:protein-disulfide isomerase